MPGFRFVFRLCLALMAIVGGAEAVWAQISPQSVLVLYDQQDADGLAISQHYANTHPGVNLLPLDLSGLSSSGEQITPEDYLNVIRPQVMGALTPDINIIVTTKGMPLRIDAGPNPDPLSNPAWGQYSSLESELARVDAIDSADEMTDQQWLPAHFGVSDVLPANPYYLGPNGLGKTYTGPQGFDRDDPTNEGIRLTARLDGFTTSDVINAIDRAQRAHIVQLPGGPTILLDDDPLNASNPGGTPSEDRMESLRDSILAPTGLPYVYDGTDQAMADSLSPVMGFVSFGTNDDPPADSGFDADYVNNQISFTPADGAVFHTYESFNAFSFDPAKRNNGQALVGDWLAIDGTAGLGHVHEPTASFTTITNEDILFDMLLNGFTFAEAAWAATRQLSFVNTVVGDPLMTWALVVEGDADLNGEVTGADLISVQQHFGASSASPDSFTFLPGDANLDGQVNGADLISVQQTFGNLAVLIDVLFGDANNDGQVTGADLIALQQNFGAVGMANGLLLGDANDDGQVTGADLIAVQQNFGAVMGSAPTGASLPEPAGLALLSVGGLLMTLPRRRAARTMPA